VRRAVASLEEFTGHRAAKLEAFEIPDLRGRAGWALGPCTQISYIATRDGETFEFEHRFAKRSRPLLVSTDDGDQLLVLGGAYSVTDRGITDA
jgi:hypothetical protein